MTGKDFLSCTSTKGCTHLVQHLFACGYLSFLGQIPCCAQCPATWDNGNLDQGIGILEMPADSGVSCFVDGDGTLLVGGHDLGLFLQAAYDAVNGTEEIFLGDSCVGVTGCNQCGFVADVGYVGSAEAGCLARQEIQVKVIGFLYGTEVYLEDCAALVDIGKIYVYLAIEATCT